MYKVMEPLLNLILLALDSNKEGVRCQSANACPWRRRSKYTTGGPAATFPIIVLVILK